MAPVVKIVRLASGIQLAIVNALIHTYLFYKHLCCKPILFLAKPVH